MVYGIDIFIPSTYSLFSPRHIPLMAVGLVQTTIFFRISWLNTIFSIVIHAFAPQVLIGVLVSLLAIRKYKTAEGPK